MKKQNRRSFLQFLGKAGLTVSAAGFVSSLESCSQVLPLPSGKSSNSTFPLAGIEHSVKDELILAEGLDYKVLLSWGDAISPTDTFGFNNDYTAFLPFDPKNPTDGLLWVNHEYYQSQFISGFPNRGDHSKKTAEQFEKEMYSVGGSLMRIKKNKANQWEVIKDDPRNRRLTGTTEIPFHWDEPIKGSRSAIGTFANCSGGLTPWGTILTCEENYYRFYGDIDYSDPNNPKQVHNENYYGWQFYKNRPPEHYGWVVEVNPETGAAKKLIALGRFAHECATTHQLKDGRLVVYSGDDSADRCLYKFIGSKPNNLKEGTLYVANIERGEWISLNYEEQKILQKNFKNQTEVLIRSREAALLVGGSKLHRPEDIEINPINGDVLISLTKHKAKGDYLGSILKIVEKNNDKSSLKFQAETYLAGGKDTGFACPDNMAFDPKGNLWITSDISGSGLGKAPYLPFGNNGLFLVPVSGAYQGKVLQIASAPIAAELTGPSFSPDGKTLFLSVQHPGESSPNLNNLTSHWPEGGQSIPKPSVVTIQGKALDALMNFEG